MEGSIFQTLLNRLTDLSTKNKSLYLPKVQGSGFIDLQEFDFLNGSPAFEILSKVIQEKKRIPLIPEVDPRLGAVNELAKQLSRIAFRDQLIQEETGEQSLYLGWPFVEGKMLNGQVLRAPILLWSIELGKKDGNWSLLLQESCQWNSAFLLAYSHGYNLKLNSEEVEDRLENLPNDPMEFRTALRQILEEKFAVQISSGLFEDRIAPFPNSQISVDSHKFQDGRLAVKSYAVLGQFAQKGSFLFKDYEELKSTATSLESFLESEFQVRGNSKVIREEQTFTVFPVDASQENVLHKVRQGKSLVVEGPPGTGKSQLIANLVSDYTARGKKVLVVSQKRAALDVVFQRLDKLGMGDFLGLVHDFRADQKSLFQKLKRQIEAIESYQEANRGLDAIQLEREISVLSSTISRFSNKFESLREALFESESSDLPIKAMYLEIESKGEFLAGCDAELKSLKYAEAQSFERNLKIFKTYEEQFQNSFWDDRVSFSDFGLQQYTKINSLLIQLENFPSEFRSGIGLRNFQEVIISGKVLSESLGSLLDSVRVFDNLDLLKAYLLKPSERKNALIVKEWLIEKLNQVQNLTLPIPQELEKIEKELLEVAALRKSWYGKLALTFRRQSFARLYQWLECGGLSWNLGNLELAQETFDKFTDMQRESTSLQQIEGFEISLLNAEISLDLLKSAEDLYRLWLNVDGLESYWSKKEVNLDREGLLCALEELHSDLTQFENEVATWRIYFTPKQIIKLLWGKEKASSLNVLQICTDLTAFDQFLESLSHNERTLVHELQVQFPNSDLKSLTKIFWNSWYSSWISELERRNPILLEAGSVKLTHEMDELKEAIVEKRKLSRFMTLLRLREQMTDALEYNRLGNRLTYRELLHQVSKKRQKWPLRKLLESFSEEIFRLLPCWLASPETVSALFPLGQKFDLVIFDEASQCPVEKGLPAMLRGNQLVVAGDSKQLRPSDFYQVKWDSEEGGLDYEAESLLELAGNYFEKTMLRGHYRSADPILIQFSNLKFYDGRLEVLPDFDIAMAAKTPFSWEKVEGIWENQRNLTEADRVIEVVKSILDNSPSDSIGIVTGNYFQMELISEKLWENAISEEHIKVRNIENVQGDEFDQVILSLGYAPNREGKLVTNFGLLGKSGAENRLNVASTRARKHMHVISSMDPEDFRVTHLKNPGLALLQEFLSYAKSQAEAPRLTTLGGIHSKFQVNWSLKNKLLESESSFKAKVPSSVMDLVKDEGTSQVAILTDDQRFFDSPSAKAAMAYHPILLESKGWKWEWKWSRGQFFSGQ